MIVTTKNFSATRMAITPWHYIINNLEQTVGLFRGNLGKVGKNEDPVNPAVGPRSLSRSPAEHRGYTDKRFWKP